MTFLLAMCLSLAVGADSPRADSRSARAADENPAAAGFGPLFESLDRQIEESSTHPELKSQLAQMYGTRGWLRLRTGELEKARSDFDAALALDPNSFYAHSGRAEYFRQTGQPALAEAEMRQIDGRYAAPGDVPFFDDTSFSLFDDRPVTPAAAWIILALSAVAATILHVIAGRRQKVEASGSLLRLVGAAVYLGMMGTLPLLVWAVSVSAGSATGTQLRIAGGTTIVSILLLMAYLQPPVRLHGTKEKLPRVTDEAFLARVAELAGKMKVPIPIIRLWPSLTGSQQALAFAGTIHAPQLVVTDGILHRLSPAERDAIVAHELGHIANGSLWFLAAVFPVSCAAATAASVFVPQSIVWPFAIAFFVGLRRLLSRPFEIDCDCRAARAIGFRDTAAALAKIHAVHPVRNKGLLSLLVYATATHPSREIRLAALRDAAPEADRPDLELSESRIRWQRRLTIAALTVWLVTVTGMMVTTVLQPDLAWLSIPLWVVGLTPMGLIMWAKRKNQSLARVRMGKRRARNVAILVGGLAAFTMLLTYTSHDTPDPIPLLGGIQLSVATSLLLLSCVAGLSVWSLWTNGRRKLRQAVAVALQVHDFPRVVELARQSPKVVARDHILRYNVALARAVCDSRPAAITMLEGLAEDKSGFHLTAFLLGQLLLDSDQPERALVVARKVVEQLPRDAGTHALEARVQRRLGRLDEAQAACDRVLALEPEDGIGLGVSAAIALDRGDLRRARELIGAALEHSPGQAYLLVLRAEISLHAESLEAARGAVEQALSAVRNNPLVFLQSDLARLEQKLWDREGSAPIFSGAERLEDRNKAPA